MYLIAAEANLERAIVSADPPRPQKKRLGRGGALRPSRGAGDTRPRFGVFLHSKGFIFLQNYFEEGDYTIRVQAFGQQVGDEPVKAELLVNGKALQAFDIAAEEASPQVYEIKAHFPTGPARMAVSFLNPFQNPFEQDPARGQRLLVVREVEIDGPYNSPPPALPASHRRLLEHQPALLPRDAAREILTRFASRAFRRPVQPREVARFLRLFDQAERDGERFEVAMRLALSAVLVSPHFLFRIEVDPPDAKPQTPYAVNEYELASRLSYFLWSSMPDDELFRLAERGQLRANLEAQARRMLQDPKASGFVRNFSSQWLTTRNLAFVVPDAQVFPSFDDELRSAMLRETELFFEAIVREDRSILDLIDADFSFVNERLAKHYGIQGVTGKEFRRVKLPANRGGILTQASILTLTSNPTRTSPVKRGKWVLEQLLGTPPPPPPDAGELEEDEKAQLSGSLRQRMEQHRSKPSCAVCHNKLDPLGFAFENYDAIGRWRTKDGKFDIDPAGTLPDSQAFQGPGELKGILKGKKELFARNLAEKMLTYALGRGMEYYDRCAVDPMVGALSRNDYRFATLVVEIVRSEPFQMRTAMGRKD
jgi:hypothetical protein